MPEQLPNTVGPPALHRIGLCEQVLNGLVPTNENHSLPQQPCLKDIPMLIESPAGKFRMPEKGQGFQDPCDGLGCRQWAWCHARASGQKKAPIGAYRKIVVSATTVA